MLQELVSYPNWVYVVQGAERIGNSGIDDLMTVNPETVEADFRTAAIGTLVAGQWFANNANTSRVKQGEYPLLLVTGGLLHQVS
jgi:hypothetical protein